MVRSFGSFCAHVMLPVLMIVATSCGMKSSSDEATRSLGQPTQTSSLDTVNIPHSSVKWQSIGNCWAYAALGWVESMLLRGPELVQPNFSETYVTYPHYELQLMEMLFGFIPWSSH